MLFSRGLGETDPEVSRALALELDRQRNTIELIASENLVSRAVMEAQASVLTNKYAEGYPGHRYYGGCQYVDVVENLARDRLKMLFSAEYANVQPHSGSQANTAVYFALLRPGDLILGMNLAHGGHLTHGSPVNLSGKYFRIASYGVERETGRIDYERLRAQALEVRPRLIVAGASAYPRAIDFAMMGAIARECGAYLMVDMAHIAGLVAAGLHMSPLPYADVVTSTTHKTLRGPRGGVIMAREKYGPALDKAIFPGIQGGPLMHVIAAKAVAFGEALQPSFRAYQKQVVQNARTLAAALVERGFQLVSGGTDNHLLLVDLHNKNVTGRDAELALDRVGITVNKNAVPFDDRPPTVTSGIRLGTPAVTTRGMREEEMAEIADLIASVVQNMGSEEVMRRVRRRVEELVAGFPLYPGM